MKKILILVLVLLIVISGCVNQSQNNLNNSSLTVGNNFSENLKPGFEKGNLALDFSFTTIDEKTVKLSDFKGKYVLFAAFASWCTPCQIEAKNVAKAQKDFENLPLVVMQIDVDPRETKQDLINFKESFGREDWLMGFDDGTISNLYNIRTLDTTLIVDPIGKIVYRDNGFPLDTKILIDLVVKGESNDLELNSIHEHANIKVVLNGDEIDFSKDEYQLRSPFVHFEKGEGKKVHVHAKGVTLKYLFETLGWKVNNECIEINSEKYCNGSIKVNGNNSSFNHEIREGENIEVNYNS